MRATDFTEKRVERILKQAQAEISKENDVYQEAGGSLPYSNSQDVSNEGNSPKTRKKLKDIENRRKGNPKKGPIPSGGAEKYEEEIPDSVDHRETNYPMGYSKTAQELNSGLTPHNRKADKLREDTEGWQGSAEEMKDKYGFGPGNETEGWQGSAEEMKDKYGFGPGNETDTDPREEPLDIDPEKLDDYQDQMSPGPGRTFPGGIGRRDYYRPRPRRRPARSPGRYPGGPRRIGDRYPGQIPSRVLDIMPSALPNIGRGRGRGRLGVSIDRLSELFDRGGTGREYIRYMNQR